jgi:zinc protease
MAALFDELRKVADAGYFSADELQNVKAQRAFESAMGAERTSGLTHTIGFWWSVADLDYFMGYVDAMAQQTPADLQRYAARYIVGRPHVTGVLLSADDRRRLGLTEQQLLAYSVEPAGRRTTSAPRRGAR